MRAVEGVLVYNIPLREFVKSHVVLVKVDDAAVAGSISQKDAWLRFGEIQIEPGAFAHLSVANNPSPPCLFP